MSSKANITIEQGATFNVEIALQDENGDVLNLAGFSAYGKIKRW